MCLEWTTVGGDCLLRASRCHPSFRSGLRYYQCMRPGGPTWVANVACLECEPATATVSTRPVEDVESTVSAGVARDRARIDRTNRDASVTVRLHLQGRGWAAWQRFPRPGRDGDLWREISVLCCSTAAVAIIFRCKPAGPVPEAPMHARSDEREDHEERGRPHPRPHPRPRDHSEARKRVLLAGRTMMRVCSLDERTEIKASSHGACKLPVWAQRRAVGLCPRRRNLSLKPFSSSAPLLVPSRLTPQLVFAGGACRKCSHFPLPPSPPQAVVSTVENAPDRAQRRSLESWTGRICSSQASSRQPSPSPPTVRRSRFAGPLATIGSRSHP